MHRARPQRQPRLDGAQALQLAFSPGDVLGVSIFVGLLLVLWLVHAWAQRRHHAERDPRLVAARERRGF